jgi:hypothetical protein
VASDGGIFTFGDAVLRLDGRDHLNQPIVGMAATPDGKGYWLVASDGGIFSLRRRRFFGSTGAIHLNQPIVGMAATPDGGATGWWPPTAASSPSATPRSTARPAGSISTSPSWAWRPPPTAAGYWLVASDGGIFTFGDAAVLRLDRRPSTQPAHRGHGRHPRRRRVLAGGLRRRHLHLRRRAVLRLDRRHPPEQTDRGMAAG